MVLAISLIASTLTHAQSDTLGWSKDKTTSKEVEIISEKRIATSGFSEITRDISILNSEMLRDLPVTSVQEALQYISGVDLRQRGPMGVQGDLTIMGSTFDQVLILINGIPMRDPQTGHNQMNLPVSLNLIDRIEIMMGSASRIYGANAMTGAINIVTKPAGDELVFVQAYAGTNFQNDTASNKQYYLIGGQASLGFNTTKTHHQVDVSFIETNGYRYNSDNSQQRVNYIGKIQLGEGLLDIFGGTVFNSFGANNFYAAPNDKNATESVSTVYGGLKYQLEKGNWSIRPIVYTRYNHDDYIYIKQKPDVYRNNHYTTASGAEFHASRLNRLGAMGLGIESRAEIINSTNLGKHERYFQTLYAEQKFYLSNEKLLTVGANAQYNNNYGWRVYPGLEYGAKIKWINGLRWYANIGMSNRLPTYTDLYYAGPGNIGNENLTPENSTQSEMGAIWKLNNWSIQIGGFGRAITNYIDFARDSMDSPWKPQNFGKAQFVGSSSRIAYVFNPSQQFFRLHSFRVDYTFIEGNFNSNGLESKYVMEHLSNQITGTLVLHTSKYFTHSLSGRYAERFNGQEYAVFDYRVRFKHGAFAAFADISNILDRKYIESGIIEMPGRWFRIGAEFSIHRNP